MYDDSKYSLMKHLQRKMSPTPRSVARFRTEAKGSKSSGKYHTQVGRRAYRYQIKHKTVTYKKSCNCLSLRRFNIHLENIFSWQNWGLDTLTFTSESYPFTVTTVNFLHTLDLQVDSRLHT